MALWGVVAGAALAPRVLQPVSVYVKSQTVVIVVMFLMSVTLDLSQIVAALKQPGKVLLGVVLGYVLAPLFGWFAAQAFWKQSPDFSVGTLIIVAMPCTLASATIWTRLAGGNDALSLLCTVVSNGLSFALTPLLLVLTLGHSASLDPLDLLGKLFLNIFLPVVVGQVARAVAALRAFATARKVALSMVSQLLILSMIMSGIIKASLTVRESAAGFAWLDFGGLVLAIAVVHGLALVGCWIVARAFHLPRRDRLALLFAGSQKTLPAGLYVADNFFPTYHLATLPILLYHSLQLVLDSWVANEVQRRGERLEHEGCLEHEDAKGRENAKAR
jgi:sodium/bile acid cotransporter 7